MKKKEWWDLVGVNWHSLRSLCYQYLPMSEKIDADGEPSDTTISDQITTALEHRDEVLSRFLAELLWRLPDNEDTRSLPVYAVLAQLVEEDPF